MALLVRTCSVCSLALWRPSTRPTDSTEYDSIGKVGVLSAFVELPLSWKCSSLAEWHVNNLFFLSAFGFVINFGHL